ncbi:hypothetical protein BH10PAT1_BH10PAT1_2370 [soil metagenome]
MHHSRLAERKLGQKSVVTKKVKNYVWLKILLIITFILFLSGILFYIISPKNWDGKSKISIAVQNRGMDVTVEILDPTTSSITKINIPAETEVQAANQLGTWKLGSITRLGKDKKLKGDFLKNTIIKSFNFPIDEWADANFFDSIFKSDSSFSLLDKIRISLFTLGVNNSQKTDIDLSQTNYLQRVQLTDGSLGWEISGDIPTNIESYFTDQNFADENLTILLNNGSESNAITNTLARTIQTLGVNIASTQNISASNSNCNITGLNKIVVTKIAKIFSCSTKISKPENNFDIQIDLGKIVKNRF